VGEAFQSFLVSTARTPTKVEAAMLIEKPGKELLGGGFRAGVAGSPDFFAVRMKPNPVGRITLVTVVSMAHVYYRLQSAAGASGKHETSDHCGRTFCLR
jgi:hypothetical protein